MMTPMATDRVIRLIRPWQVTRKRCWGHDWVLEFDIRGLFDNIDHGSADESGSIITRTAAGYCCILSAGLRRRCSGQTVRNQWCERYPAGGCAYATNNIAKSHVNWGIRIRRECLSGFFRESPEAHVSLFLDIDPIPSQRRKRKS